MRKLFFIVQFILFFLASAKAQEGMWVWIHGDSSNTSSPAVFGTKGIPNVANTPPGLYESAEWTDAQGNFWLFGGVNGFYWEYNTLWKYNPGTDEWTWISGSNFPGAFPVHGTQGIPSPLNTPGARGWGAVSWVDINGNFWLFGGYGVDANGARGCLNDLWKFDPLTTEWTWMAGSKFKNSQGNWGTLHTSSPLNQPTARNESNCSWTDSVNLWMYGGLDSAWNAYNDMWKFDVTTNEWTWMWGSTLMNQNANHGTKNVESASNDPGGRFSYTKFNDGNGSLYLLGAGTSYTGELYADVWRYKISSEKWTWTGGEDLQNTFGSYIDTCLKDSINSPASKYEMRASWPSECGFWFFGGAGTGGIYNDLWYYNLFENTFTWVNGNSSSNPYTSGNYGVKGIPASANVISSRIGSSAWQDTLGNLWLYGGMFWDTVGMNNWKFKNDLWKFQPDTSCVQLCASIVIPIDSSVTDTLDLDSLFIPNVFSPNDDGANDYFEIIAVGYKSYLLKIYNRWGELIFLSDDPRKLWDGKSETNQKEVPEGTYYYIFELSNFSDEKKIYNGFLTLLRDK